MNVNFEHTDAGAVQPIIFEQVIGEKPGGGVVANPAFDLPIGLAVGIDAGAIKPIKAYRLVLAVAALDTTIRIAKGSGHVVGDIIAHGGLGVASTAVDITNAAYDLVTVTMGVVIANDTVLFQGDVAHATDTVPIYTPSYLLGTPVYAGLGDQLAKLVNIANVRKETVPAALEVLAAIQTIKAV